MRERKGKAGCVRAKIGRPSVTRRTNDRMGFGER
jgi:hypothetical protein